jgi:hypothetical protein
MLACSDGTSGWVLSEVTPSSGIGGTVEDAAPPDVAAPETGPAPEASVDAPLSCPTTFSDVCSPEIVVENRDLGGGGILFDQNVPDPQMVLGCVARHVCSILYRNTAEVRPTPRIRVIVENFAGISSTYRGDGEHIVRISSQFLQDTANSNRDVRRAIFGVLYFHGANVFQRDDGNSAPILWLIQGVADYVRHRGGYLSLSQRRPGGSYTDGFSTTAFFLAWLDEQYPDFIYRLNLSLDPADGVTWSVQTFQDLTSKDVDTLWADYQAAL